MSGRSIIVVGAGIIGLWQALVLLRAGHRVRIIDRSEVPFEASASRLAGAMLGPDCEAEAAPAVVRDLGRNSIGMWRAEYPDLIENGTLVVAAPRDEAELVRFARLTERFETLDGAGLASREPALAGRFRKALFFSEEAHLDAIAAMNLLLKSIIALGGSVELGSSEHVLQAGDLEIDCRGFAAQNEISELRGVRGERIIVTSSQIHLSRPIRLLHPRQPIYVVPLSGDRFVIGATVIEREDDGPMSVRSAFDLLGAAFSLHPAFAEAGILDMAAGIRPAFRSNVPAILIRDGGWRILVNGAYRHGFLLAPVLAAAVAHFVATGDRDHALIANDA